MLLYESLITADYTTIATTVTVIMLHQLVRQKYVAGQYHLALLHLKLLVLYTVTLNVASSKQRLVTEHSDTQCYNRTYDMQCICYKPVDFNQHNIAQQQYRFSALIAYRIAL
jgi:hypothetical protein